MESAKHQWTAKTSDLIAGHGDERNLPALKLCQRDLARDRRHGRHPSYRAYLLSASDHIRSVTVLTRLQRCYCLRGSRGASSALRSARSDRIFLAQPHIRLLAPSHVRTAFGRCRATVPLLERGDRLGKPQRNGGLVCCFCREGVAAGVLPD